MVRRHLVESGPGVRHRRVAERRQPPDRHVDHSGQEVPLHRDVEPRVFVGIAHAEQQPPALAVKVEGRFEIDDHQT